MCQPSDVSRFGGLLPPTLVAIPLWNFWVSGSLLMMSQTPQKPTYAASSCRSMAVMELVGVSSPSGVPPVFSSYGSPG
jgi:hypothetical protein